MHEFDYPIKYLTNHTSLLHLSRMCLCVSALSEYVESVKKNIYIYKETIACHRRTTFVRLTRGWQNIRQFFIS